MDRESSDTEDVENRNHEGGNMEESDEDSDTDDQALFVGKVNLETTIGKQTDDIKQEMIESAAEEIRRLYENSSGSIAASHRLIPPPVAHRSASLTGNSGNLTGNMISSMTNTLANFNPQQLANEQLLQYTIVNYLQQQQQQQQQANNSNNYQQVQQSPSSHYAALPPSMQSAAALMQQSMAAAAAANSFQSSVPPGRLSSSPLHHLSISASSQKRHTSSPTLNSYRRSPTNFQSPPPAHSRRSASVSSRQSREESTSPVAQSSWSFEEQFKQLYDIDKDDPKRREFLDDLFSFMQKHGLPVRESYSKINNNTSQSLAKSATPIMMQDIEPTKVIYSPVTRLPIMAKSVLDLYELYKLVVQRGGLVDVINKKLWQEVIKGLNLPSSITSAAFTLRTQYMKFLYRYECAKLNLSSTSELHAAIEGNKREGRRTSYPYGELGHSQSPNHHHHHHPHHHHQQQQVHHNGGTSSSLTNGPLHHLISPPTSHQSHHHHHHQSSSRISPVSLINNRQPQLNGHGGGAHSIASFATSTNANILSHVAAGSGANIASSIPSAHCVPPLMLQGTSPEITDGSILSNLDMTQLALWNFYNGVVKQPQQANNPISTFQAAVSQVHQKSMTGNGTSNEAPLDLGKRRSTDPLHSSSNSSIPPAKKEALHDNDNDEGDASSSISESESNDDPEKNSSQEKDGSPSSRTSDPVVVKMHINGVKYKGVLHPVINDRRM